MMPLTCAACGQPMTSMAAFCGNCGQPVRRACSQCGGSIGAQAQYCGTCGSAVVDLAAVAAGAPVQPTPPPPTGPAPAQPVTPPTPAPFGAPMPPVAAGPRRRPSANLSVVLALVAVVAVAAGGFVVLHPGASSSLATPPMVDGFPDPLALTMPESPAGSLPPINETKPTTGHLTIGAETPLATQTIGTAGGTIAAQGLQIQVSDGTLAADANFDVKQAPITGNTFGGFVTPITPLYLIDDGGASFGKPVTVTLPATIPAGKTAMAFSYDDASGMLTPLMPIAQDATTLTVGAMHFSPFFGGLVDLAEESTSPDSGFRPGMDDWQFPNYGSYIAPDGMCEGKSVSEIWYYVNQRRGANAHQLYGLSDNNGAPTKTPGLWVDDSYGYRMASVVQADPVSDARRYSFNEFFHGATNAEDTAGRVTYEAFRTAIATTGQPQLIRLGTDAFAAGHTMVVYQVTPDRIYVADPNYPGLKNNPRWVPYDAATGKLGPYSSGINSAAIAENGERSYTRFWYQSPQASTSDAAVAAHWAEFQAGTVGVGRFPEYDLEALAGKDEQGQDVWAPLVDGYRTSDEKLTVRVSDAAGTNNVMMKLYLDTWATPAAPAGRQVTIDLKDGKNPLGILEEGRPGAGVGWRYVDFVRLNVVRGDPTTLVFDPATPKDGPVDLGITFKATATGIPATAKHVSFAWDFGDGLVTEDPIDAPDNAEQASEAVHAYSKEGSYTVTVILYDTTGSGRVELARATWAVQIAAAAPTPTPAAEGSWVLVEQPKWTPRPQESGELCQVPVEVTEGSVKAISATCSGLDSSVEATWSPAPFPSALRVGQNVPIKMMATVSGTAHDHVNLGIQARPDGAGLEDVSVGGVGNDHNETIAQATADFEPPANWAGSNFVIEITVYTRWSQEVILDYPYRWQP